MRRAARPRRDAAPDAGDADAAPVIISTPPSARRRHRRVLGRLAAPGSECSLAIPRAGTYWRAVRAIAAARMTSSLRQLDDNYRRRSAAPPATAPATVSRRPPHDEVPQATHIGHAAKKSGQTPRHAILIALGRTLSPAHSRTAAQHRTSCRTSRRALSTHTTLTLPHYQAHFTLAHVSMKLAADDKRVKLARYFASSAQKPSPQTASAIFIAQKCHAIVLRPMPPTPRL